jgi:ribosomal protein L11 methylase PrmA
MKPRHAYENDLAYIHDRGFGAFATGSAPYLLKMLQQQGISEGLVVDLGCGSIEGPGRTLAEFLGKLKA